MSLQTFISRALVHSVLHWGALAVGALALGSVTSGCSMSQPENRVIRVEVPGALAGNTAVQKVDSSYKTLSAFGSPQMSINASFAPPSGIVNTTDPLNISLGFQCFGISVSAPDIPDDPVGCHANPVGMLAGLIPASSGGVIEVSVPAGAARHIKLIGIQSTIPDILCPPVADILAGKYDTPGTDHKDNLGDPIQLDEQVVDVFDDVVVDLYAKFDPTHPINAFGTCAGGDGGITVPLTLAKKGHRTDLFTTTPTPWAPPSPNPLASPSPTVLMDPDFHDPVDLDISQVNLKSGLQPGALVDDPLISVIHDIDSVAGGRAAIRLAWDVEPYANANPYLELALQFAGGRVLAPGGSCTDCTPGSLTAFFARVATPPSFGGEATTSGPGAFWFNRDTRLSSHMILDPISNHRFVLVELDSQNFADSNWNSRVILTGARVAVRPTPKPLQAAASVAGIPNATQAVEGGNLSFYAWGGADPYQWSWKWQGDPDTSYAPIACGMPCTNASMAAPSLGGGGQRSITVRVTDSDTGAQGPQTYTFDILVTPIQAMTKLLMHGTSDVSPYHWPVLNTGLSSNTVALPFSTLPEDASSQTTPDVYFEINNSGADGAFNFGLDDVTVEAWVKLSSPITSDIGLVGNNDNSNVGWQLHITVANGLTITTGDGISPQHFYANDSATWLTTPAWHHVAWVKQGTTCGLLRDGILLAKGPCGALANSPRDLFVGKNPYNSSTFPPYTSIGEVRVSRGVHRWDIVTPSVATTVYPLQISPYIPD